MGGHDCDLLTITDFTDGEEDDARQKTKKRIATNQCTKYREIRHWENFGPESQIGKFRK